MEKLTLFLFAAEEERLSLMKQAIAKSLPNGEMHTFCEAGFLVEQLDKIFPDVIVCDYGMPELTGIQLLKSLKAKQPEVPIVAVCKDGGAKAAIEALDYGASDYLLMSGGYLELLPVVALRAVKRRRLERLLNEHEVRYRDFAERVFDWVWELDSQGKYLHSNFRVKEILGYTPDEVVGRYFYDFVVEDQKEILKQRFFEIMSQRRSITESRITFVHRDGGEVIVDTKGIPFFDTDGELIGYRGVHRDLTEHKQIEDALRKSEEKLNNILHGSSIPTFVINKEHHVTYWNKALEQYSGINAEDIIGTDDQWKAFYDKKRPSMADLLVDEKIDDIPGWYPGKYRISELIEGAYEALDFFPRVGESGKWLYLTAAPLRDREGRIIGAVETLQDITQTKEAEEQIKLLSREIIAIQEKEREYLSREIHDNIGQLLGALKMGLSHTKKKIPNELSLIKDQMNELSDLLNKIIREMRGLSHALHPPLIEDLGLTSALEGLCQDFKSYSEIKISWDFEEPQKPLEAVTNITLYRLFQEALSNILKHSRASEVKVSLKYSGDRIIAVIEDNGLGFVVEDAVVRAHGKKTLGLMSMKERLALLGGQLTVVSSPGQGTTIIAQLERG